MSTWLHIGSLTAAFIFFLILNSHQWFFGDEWDFLVDRTVVGGNLGVWVPHNEHWSTLPVLLYAGLFHLIGLKSYVPYVLPVILAHLAIAHLLWRIMLRAGVAHLTATALTVAFLFFGEASENLLWGFQIGFVGAVALGLLHVIAVDHPGRADGRDRLGWVVSCVALMFSGIAVAMTAVAGLAAGFRNGLRRFLTTVVPPAIVYVAWLAWLGYQGLSAHPSPTAASLLTIPQFVGGGLAATVSWGTGSSLVGVLVVGLVVALLLVRVRRGDGIPTSVLATALGAPILLTIVALGRAQLGLETASSPRYGYVLAALILPIIGIAFNEIGQRGLVGGAVVVVVSSCSVVFGVVHLAEAARFEADREESIREQLVAALRLVDSGDLLVGENPEPMFSPNLQLGELVRLRDSLPTDTRVSREAVLRARIELQTVLTTTLPPAGDGVAARVSTVRDAFIAHHGSDCVTMVPTGSYPRMRVDFDPPSWIELSPARDGTLRFVEKGGGSKLDHAIEWPLPSSQVSYLGLALESGIGILGFSATGDVDICRVLPSSK